MAKFYYGDIEGFLISNLQYTYSLIEMFNCKIIKNTEHILKNYEKTILLCKCEDKKNTKIVCDKIENILSKEKIFLLNNFFKNKDFFNLDEFIEFYSKTFLEFDEEIIKNNIKIYLDFLFGQNLLNKFETKNIVYFEIEI